MLGTRITSTQIASGVPCFQMMKCWRAGGGDARCWMYGFRERASDVNKKKKTAAGCLPLSVPGRNRERALAQWEGINLPVTLFNLAAGPEDGPAGVLGCPQDLHITHGFWASSWPQEGLGKLLWRQSPPAVPGGFCAQPTARVGLEQR